MNSERYYQTSDLALAAALYLDYQIYSLDHSDPRRITFIFCKGKDFDLYLEHYWQEKLRVEPQKYFHALKILKNRIYNS
jgi:hypothetical protein